MPAERAEPGPPQLEIARADGQLRLSGALVFANAAAALSALIAELARGGSFAVDLSGVRSSDSAGLAALVEWRAEARRRGVHLRLCDPPSGLRALARLSDLDGELF